MSRDPAARAASRRSTAPIEALHGVDFEVEEGGVTALLGANGAGKTTTLRAISAMIRREGEIEFRGAPMRRARARGRRAARRRACARRPRHVHRSHRRGEPAARRLYAARPRAGARPISSASSAISRGSPSASASRPARCRAASSRCWRSRARCCCARACCCSTSPRSASRRWSSPRSSASCAPSTRTSGVSILIVEQNANLALDLADRAYLMETGRVVDRRRGGDIRADDSVRRAYLGY